MKTIRRSIDGRGKTIAIGLLLAAAPGLATAVDWSGLGGDFNWSTPGNWVGGVAPASANTTFITLGAAGVTNLFVDAPWTINRLDFVGPPGYGLTGSPLTFAGAAPQINVSGTHAPQVPLVLSSTVTFNTADDITFTGGMSGPGGLTKSGPGRLTIVSPPSDAIYDGTTTIVSGTVLFYVGSIAGPVVNNAAAEFIASPATLVLAQAMSGSGGLTVLGGAVTSGGPPFTYTGLTHALSGIASGQFLGGGPLVNDWGVTITGDSVFSSLSGSGQLLTNPGSVTVGADNTSTIFTGPFVGTAGITKVGTGRLTLANAGPFHDGTTTVSAGVLRIGDGVAAPGAISGPIVNNSDLEFEVDPAPGMRVNLFQDLVGTGNLTVISGEVTSNGPGLAHTGFTTIRAGASLIGNFPNGGPLTIEAGGKMFTSGSSVIASLSGAGQLTFNFLTVGGDNASTLFSGPLSGSNNLIKVGTGRLTLSGPTMHAGPTTITAGTLRFGDGVSAPAVIDSAIFNNGALEFQVTTGTTLTAGVSGGVGSLTVLGGSVASAGHLNHSGGTVVNAGGALAGLFSGFGPLTIAAGGQVDAGDNSGFLSLSGAGLLNTTGTGVNLSDNASTTFAGVIAGTGAVGKFGPGTLTLSGASTNTGGAFIGVGTLIVTGSLAGPVTVGAGAQLGGTGTIGGPVAVNAGGTIAPGLSPGILSTGDLNLAGIAAIEIQGAALGTQYDNLNVTGTVTIAGGTLSLSGAYAPALGDVFTIISNDGADAVTGTFAGLAEGATIVFNGVTLRISYIGGTGNDVTLSAPSPVTTTWNGAGANDNWSTGLDWVGGAAPANGNTTFVTFNAASARFGPVVDAPWTINRMDIASATAYAMTGQAISFAGAGAQLNASGAVHSLANPITLTAALTVSNSSALTLSGPIGGAAGLTKTGVGGLTLSGASSYVGGTMVNSGTLLVNGTIPGPVVVNAGAALGGTGTVSGLVTINAGGTLAPGLSPGITNTGNLVLGGAFLVEIEGTTLGTQYDNTNVTGTVTIAGGTLTLAGAYAPLTGNTFTIITNDGADPMVGTFAGLPEGATLAFNGATLRISYVGGTGNDAVLTVLSGAVAAAPAGVPALSEWAMILLAALLAGSGAVAASRRR
ncbi:MAG: IPTL-CTERM sorting domain-containing protein [Betaproteobacteria bacterium]|nr:IPTL-CTERM sorting domain-containing protein [Betaproteobacteria bacterium]